MKNIWIIMLVIVSLLSISTFSNLNNLNKELLLAQEEKDKNLRHKQNEITDCQELILWNSTSNGKVLKNDFLLISDDGIYTDLGSIISNSSPLFVLRINEINCSSCINEQVKMFQKSVNNSAFKGKSVIFTTYTSMDDLYNFKKLNQLKKIPIYNVKDLRLNAETANEPYFFVLKENLMVNNIFITSKTFPNLTERYLKKIFSLN